MNRADRRAKGLYWDRAWKLVEGCTKVSPGCDNCWSETKTAMRCWHPNEKINNRAIQVIHPNTDEGFNGSITMREDNLDLPLRTKKPTVFSIWNDLYHEEVTDEFRFKAYDVMSMCPQHTFLILTKRAALMAEFFNEIFGFGIDKNVWHGISAENQQTADERIPYLLKFPGKRFLSIEPMLGSIDFNLGWNLHLIEKINAVLLGGESGKNARPMHPDWARTVRDLCAEAGVPFFFKQWGEWAPIEAILTDLRGMRSAATWFADQWIFEKEDIGGDGSYEEFEPDVWRVGKKKAGRLLDGVIHDGLPWGGAE